METKISKKAALAIMKDDIKTLVQEQRFLKNQRKDVNLIGERKLSMWGASSKHQMNREKLRLMYAAYGLVRGKSYTQIENKYSQDDHPLKEYQKQIDNIIISYKVWDEE